MVKIIQSLLRMQSGASIRTNKYPALNKVKEENEKVGLKLNSQKTKIMVSSPIASWQIDGKTMETVTGFFSSGSKIPADGDCSLERYLLLGRKAMTK